MKDGAVEFILVVHPMNQGNISLSKPALSMVYEQPTDIGNNLIKLFQDCQKAVDQMKMMVEKRKINLVGIVFDCILSPTVKVFFYRHIQYLQSENQFPKCEIIEVRGKDLHPIYRIDFVEKERPKLQLIKPDLSVDE